MKKQIATTPKTEKYTINDAFLEIGKLREAHDSLADTVAAMQKQITELQEQVAESNGN